MLAYARWRGFSWHEDVGNSRHGYWDFRPSWLLRTLFPWTLWLDAFLATISKVHLSLWRGKTIVCERFVLDMLVDLSLALDRPVLSSWLVAKLFLFLMPAGAHTFVLDLEAEVIRKRRPDLRSDRRLESRLAAFRQLSAELSLPRLSSQVSPDELSQSIWQTLIA
jgi:hypothetical protein